MLPEAWPTWLVIVSGLGIVSTAVLAIVALAVKTGRGVKFAAAWVEGVIETALLRIIRDHTLSAEQITEIVEAKVGPIHAEVRPNGGASLKDQITRMDLRDERLERLIVDHISASSMDRADLRLWLEGLDPGRLSHRQDQGLSAEDGPSY